jgi:DNA uptake protein ComE-like DNA-binding protein
MDFRHACLAASLLFLQVAGCSSRVEDSPSYKAACHGPPLRNIEQRNQAQEDGYEINRRFDCIDKASFASVSEQKARVAAANTPEAIAQREEERARWYAEQRARANAAEGGSEGAAGNASPPPVVRLDVNTASESELAGIPSIGTSEAAEIVKLRVERPFDNWADLVHRVVGLSAAQSAVYASTCGLTVNGESLLGAPPDAVMAANLRERLRSPRP